jgi:hypothetical protein
MELVKCAVLINTDSPLDIALEPKSIKDFKRVTLLKQLSVAARKLAFTLVEFFVEQLAVLIL